MLQYYKNLKYYINIICIMLSSIAHNQQLIYKFFSSIQTSVSETTNTLILPPIRWGRIKNKTE